MSEETGWTQGEHVDEPGARDGGMARRAFLARAAGTGLTLASGGFLASSATAVAKAGGGIGRTLKIGLVTPLTGEAAAFGEVNGYVLGLVTAAVKHGIKSGNGKIYDIQIISKDSQSSPSVAAQVANELISSNQIDLMLTSSTPEVVNPVSDACEAAHVPCISTVVPWEAWYYGRGAKQTDKHAFKYTYHFSFGGKDFVVGYLGAWGQLKTNKVVGVLYPNDSDGNALRAGLPPAFKQAGYKVVDAGAYPDGLGDFSPQIAAFKSNNCQIFNTVPLPPDFVTFWRQAAQQGYKPIIPQIAKTGLFPSQVEALGSLGVGLVDTAFWTPTFPYSSSLLGKTSTQLAAGYEKTGKQWTQMVGSTAALFDAGIAALKAAPDPTNKGRLAHAISTLRVHTPLGLLDWNSGPVKNVTTTPLINCQWLKGKGKYPLDLVVVNNADDKHVPVAAKVRSYLTF